MGKDYYRKIKLSEDDIRQCRYKRFLGGRASRWKIRGEHQLEFMKSMGLKKESCFLDIGCGPLRAGVHFIGYLDKNKYYGVDYNASFIEACHHIIKDDELKDKVPHFALVDSFNVDFGNMCFDFALAFSVLNHSNRKDKFAFFKNIPRRIKSGGKVYINHASWFKDEFVCDDLKISNVMAFGDINLSNGWTDKEAIHLFPIIEFTKV
jgi:SAM-dependent methyltransferase